MLRGEAGNWRLPHLRGRWLRVYEVAWIVLTLGALVSTALAAERAEWDGIYSVPLLRAGVNYTRDETGALKAVEVTSPEALAAGLRPNSRIVALADGADLDEGLATVTDLPEGASFTLTFAPKPGEPLGSARLQVSNAAVAGALEQSGFTAAGMRWITIAILVVPMLLTLGVAVLLFIRQRTNPVAALLALIPPIGAIGLTQFLLPIAVLAFPDGRFVTRAARAVLVINLVQLPFIAMDSNLSGPIGYAMVALAVVAAFIRLRASDAQQREQLRWAMLGFAGAAFFALSAAAFFQGRYLRDDLSFVIFNDLGTQISDSLYLLCLYGGLLVALLRFRLYDSQFAITRSAIWAIAAPVLAFSFATLLEVLKTLFGSLLGTQTLVASAGVITVMLITPVQQFVESRVEAWSRRDLIRFETEFPQAVADMIESDDAERLLAHVVATIRKAMRAQATAIVLSAPGRFAFAHGDGVAGANFDEWMATAELPVASEELLIDAKSPFPVRVPLVSRASGSPRALGWLLIGARPDGSVQDRDARETLVRIAVPLARALLVLGARARRQRELLSGVRQLGAHEVELEAQLVAMVEQID